MAKLKIDVNDLHKNYGKNEVLKGITTKFYEGDVVCIIGPQGSGKSTFLRSLNLLEEVTSGHITVNGYDLTEKTTNVDHVREKYRNGVSTLQPLPTHVCFGQHHLCSY